MSGKHLTNEPGKPGEGFPGLSGSSGEASLGHASASLTKARSTGRTKNCPPMCTGSSRFDKNSSLRPLRRAGESDIFSFEEALLNNTDARLKAFVTDVLKKNKALTEREVKAAVRRGLKLGRAPLGAGVIREVRKELGIDRPRAIAYAKNLLAKNPTLEAKKVIEDVGMRFGVGLGAPDVSRLRPAGARRKKALAAKTAPKPAKTAATAKAEQQPTRKAQRSHGSISVTYEARGIPEDVALFFRSLAD